MCLEWIVVTKTIHSKHIVIMELDHRQFEVRCLDYKITNNNITPNFS